MIYTLTPNPAIDMNIDVHQKLRVGVNRASGDFYSPNGKGLNVTFVLKHFKTDSKVLGFFGGFSGEYIVKETKAKEIEVKPVWVEEPTRINVFLNECGEEYKMVNKGSYVGKDKQAELLEIIRNSDDMKYLIVSGSLPPGVEESFYDEVFSVCNEKNVQVILDMSSKKLADVLKYKPLLIKPNDEELNDVFGWEIKNEQDVKDVMPKLYEMGAQNILLTLGEKGSYFYGGKDIYYTSPQKVTLVSSACAGDSALASFLSEWLKGEENLETALKLSAATGANVAESNGIGTLSKVDEYIKNITVKKI